MFSLLLLLKAVKYGRIEFLKIFIDKECSIELKDKKKRNCNNFLFIILIIASITLGLYL